MQLDVQRTKLAETAFRLEEEAAQVETIAGQLRSALDALAAVNQAPELTALRQAFDTRQQADLLNLAQALRHWSRRLESIYQTYYATQTRCCEAALKVLNSTQ